MGAAAAGFAGMAAVPAAGEGVDGDEEKIAAACDCASRLALWTSMLRRKGKEKKKRRDVAKWS